MRLDVNSGEGMGAWHISAEPMGASQMGALDDLIAARADGEVPTSSLVLTIETTTGLVHLDARYGGARQIALVLEGLVSVNERSPLDITGDMDWTKWSRASLLVLTKTNLLAQALARPQGLVVRAGSVASPTTNKSLEDTYQSIRSSLIEDGALQLEHDGFRLTRHIFFQSPSAAASVITGTNTNGRLQWRDEFGRKWAELDLG